jgi:hypothetical protein
MKPRLRESWFPVRSPFHKSAALPTGLSLTLAVLTLLSSRLPGLASPEVIGWGLNQYNQISPPSDLANVAAMSTAGGYADVDGAYSLALATDGSVLGWGSSWYGQTTIPQRLTNVAAIAGITYHCLALTAEGRVIGWGGNTYGQTNVPATLSNVVAIAAGY